jgi:hypothetical protein
MDLAPNFAANAGPTYPYPAIGGSSPACGSRRYFGKVGATIR